jgi:transposase
MPACWAGWLGGFGDIALVSVEGTGSYGAGLARHLAGVRVVEAARAGGTGTGRASPLDAVSAARAAQSGRAAGEPKGRDSTVEAIRALMVAKRSARAERTQAINQARALIVTGSDELRARFAGRRPAQLAEAIRMLTLWNASRAARQSLAAGIARYPLYGREPDREDDCLIYIHLTGILARLASADLCGQR